MADGIHIRFVEGEPKPKTKTWHVEAKDGGFLGAVMWYSAWRCYAFYPARYCVFEKVCLREIAQFCEERTAEHRAAA